jgi:putative tryptophan/tyrosine transport system substrate-binding protein
MTHRVISGGSFAVVHNIAADGRFPYLKGRSMRRRDFIQGIAGSAVAWPLAVRAQKPPVRIGYLASGSGTSPIGIDRVAAIKEGLRDQGLIEGRDYLLETRFAAGEYDRFPDLARELAQAGVAIIVTNTIASVRAAQKLSPPLPIVMVPINDPVGVGLVTSLARPGGNTTGIATLNEDLTPKLLEYQRAIVPNARVLAALFNPRNPSNLRFLDDLGAQASAIGVKVLPIELQSPQGLDAAFAAIAAHQPDALQVLGDSGNLDMSDRIAALALAQKLPSFSSVSTYAEYGGLLSYGAASRKFYVRAGFYVKKILDGANPGDLPVEQPTYIELWINLKTAKALDLRIPITLQQLADKVIE